MTDVARAIRAPGLLAEFNEAGVLHAADVHVATRLGALCGEDDERVLLACALAVRAPRLGHVYVDLARAAEVTAVESEEAVDLSALAWPDPDAWTAAVAASPLTAGPLVLDETRLYLDRYWREETALAEDLLALAAAPAEPVEPTDDQQAFAAATAVSRQFAVIAGGPGTGKTTTIARIVALLLEQATAAGAPPPLIALAAPTGKAAARLQDAVGDARLDLPASTLHRLLGWRPDSSSRFRYNRANRLPHDVVIVDETSMVSLTLMARLVEAIRPDARLVLVGDPDQLTSIEAGAVLGDIVAAGGDGVVTLQRVHRFSGLIADLASAISAGDADAAIEVLRAGTNDVTWIETDAAEADPAALEPVRGLAVTTALTVIEAATAADAPRALAALNDFRLLCAHRRGPHGAQTWMRTIERWIAAKLPGFNPEADWYVGRPLLVTENDYSLKLYNGDTGVVIATAPDRIAAAFERQGSTVEFSPTRLGAVDTVYAMTIHKSQGSQFRATAVVLPPPESPILTRELLYTAATRASERLTIVGTEDALRVAIARPAARASALSERLWRR